MVPVFIGAIIGGFIGSYFGVAGFGSAISGTIPLALIGAYIGWRISEKESLSEELMPYAAKALRELDEGARDDSLWASVYSASNGNSEKATALYIKKRAAKLLHIATESERRQQEIEKEEEEERARQAELQRVRDAEEEIHLNMLKLKEIPSKIERRIDEVIDSLYPFLWWITFIAILVYGNAVNLTGYSIIDGIINCLIVAALTAGAVLLPAYIISLLLPNAPKKEAENIQNKISALSRSIGISYEKKKITYIPLIMISISIVCIVGLVKINADHIYNLTDYLLNISL